MPRYPRLINRRWRRHVSAVFAISALHAGSSPRRLHFFAVPLQNARKPFMLPPDVVIVLPFALHSARR